MKKKNKKIEDVVNFNLQDNLKLAMVTNMFTDQESFECWLSVLRNFKNLIHDCSARDVDLCDLGESLAEVVLIINNIIYKYNICQEEVIEVAQDKLDEALKRAIKERGV